MAVRKDNADIGYET